jgi:predicted CoA-binding protein
VVIATPPSVALGLVRECHELGIRRVWMHRSFGRGSVSDEAVRFGREHGITVIPGACPFLYCKPVDPFHACLRWILRITGGLPKVHP